MLHDQIALAENAAQGAVGVHHGQTVKVMFQHQAGGLGDLGAHRYGQGMGCHDVAGRQHGLHLVRSIACKYRVYRRMDAAFTVRVCPEESSEFVGPRPSVFGGDVMVLSL